MYWKTLLKAAVKKEPPQEQGRTCIALNETTGESNPGPQGQMSEILSVRPQGQLEYYSNQSLGQKETL